MKKEADKAFPFAHLTWDCFVTFCDMPVPLSCSDGKSNTVGVGAIAGAEMYLSTYLSRLSYAISAKLNHILLPLSPLVVVFLNSSALHVALYRSTWRLGIIK